MVLNVQLTEEQFLAVIGKAMSAGKLLAPP